MSELSPDFKPRENDASEFEPLPFYPFDERSLAATRRRGMRRRHGDLGKAAALLKVSPARRQRPECSIQDERGGLIVNRP